MGKRAEDTKRVAAAFKAANERLKPRLLTMEDVRRHLPLGRSWSGEQVVRAIELATRRLERHPEPPTLKASNPPSPVRKPERPLKTSRGKSKG